MLHEKRFRINIRPCHLTSTYALITVATFLFSASPVRAQIVTDGQTNTFNNVTTIVTGDVTVGVSGSFTSLILTNFARMTNSTYGIIGFNSGANSNTVFLQGPNTRWDLGTDIYVGSAGTFNRLIISNNSTVANSIGVIGFTLNANNNQVTVTGTGSVWTNRSDLYIGNSGAGSSLLITGGGRVVNRLGYLGGDSIATNNQVIVSGLNSVWINSEDLTVGLGGSGNTVLLTSGGQVANTSGFIGNNARASNNLVTVTGAGSLWTNRSDLQVGVSGSFNTLVITNGGRVTGGNGTLGYFPDANNNQVTVTGINSLWTNRSDLSVGSSGSFNTLFITSGGRVVNNKGTVGFFGIGNQVTVTGAGSLWANRNELNVGDYASGNTLLIANGATVANGLLFIGRNDGASNNRVTVTGPDSRLTNSSDLTVGHLGSFNTLLITNEAIVLSSSGYIGRNTGASNNQVTVSSPGSLWKNSDGLQIGGSSSFNMLLITNGGQVVSGFGDIGVGGNNNQAVVTGTDALWNNIGDLTVGNISSLNRLLITSGGHVVNDIGVIGFFGTGNQTTVAGTNSLWTNGRDLFVGAYGSLNTLLITNGGRVVSGKGYIGREGNSNQVIVTGSNSQWNIYGDLNVGQISSGNLLCITNGGSVQAVNVFLVAAGSSNNLLKVNNGSLTVTAGGTGVFEVTHGSVVLDGGTITVDRLLLNGSPSDTITFNTGLLNVRRSTVVNGTPFTVGNGSSAATYRMSGIPTDLHAFFDGLVIASNATLAGNGTVGGSVTSFGAIALDNSAGNVRLNAELSLASSARMGFEIGGLATGQYDQVAVQGIVQFAGTLSLSFLNGFVPASTNSFTLMTFSSSSGFFANATNGATVQTDDGLYQFTVVYTPTSLVLVNAQPADGPSFDMTAIIPTAAQVALLFQSSPSNAYELQYSSTLTNWTTVVNTIFTTNAPGSTEWIDNGSLTGGLPPMRVYRVRQLP